MKQLRLNFLKTLGVCLVFGLIGCEAGKNRPTVELIQDMMDQKNLKSQDYDEMTHQPANRMPVDGTVPRGYTPYKYKGNIAAAEANLVNPLSRSEASLARGQERFDIYCAVCHGPQGQGDGTVAQYLAPKPPSLVSDKAKAYKDGRFFHIITEGYGVMMSYAPQIQKEEDRWAIVNYIRELQKKQ